MQNLKKLSTKQIEKLNAYKREKGRSATEALRVIAILLFEDKADSEFIHTITGQNRKYASNLRRKYIRRGVDSLNDRKGKKPRALLTKGQRKEIAKVIATVTPRAFGLEEDHWTTSILGYLIKEQYNVQYKSRTSLVLLFEEAKFTYHKPDKQYRARKQRVIDEWIEKNKPTIQEAMNDQETAILVADEMMLSTQTTTQKIWLPKGEFPKIDVSSNRKVRCIYGALDVKTGREYAFKKMRANSTYSCEFLDQIGNLYKNYKIVLIWDNASWHKSQEVKAFLSNTKHNFHLMNFPPYAPELNPQEHVWKEGRSKISHNKFIENIDKATDKFVQFLNMETFDYKFL